MASTLAGRELPVFLADNHAETFGWITRTFDPDEARALVLVDAHSDASAVERSDEVREGLRRVPSEEARAAKVEAWRKDGRVQAFNWIEPLMPRPLDQVIWLAAPEMDAAARLAATAEAAAQLDGRLEVEPRSAGAFATRWETVDLTGFTAWKPAGRPVILAVDLDFFAGMKAEDRERHFEAIWKRAMEWPGLECVAFAVSRPWLSDDEEADALVSLAVDAVRRTRGARLEIDASIDDRPDDSRQAKERVARGESIPRWDLGRSMPRLRMSLAQLGKRLTIRDRGIDWSAVPLVWSGMYGSGWIRPASGEVDCDRVWRFPRGGEPVLRVEASPGAPAGCAGSHLSRPGAPMTCSPGRASARSSRSRRDAGSTRNVVVWASRKISSSRRRPGPGNRAAVSGSRPNMKRKTAGCPCRRSSCGSARLTASAGHCPSADGCPMSSASQAWRKAT